MKKFQLSRRTMLRGAAGGASIAIGLPILEAMVNDNGTAFADGTGLPKRFMTFYWADGINIGQFEPAAQGPNWVPANSLAAFANNSPNGNEVKSYVSVITGLLNHCQNPITHHEGMAGFNGYSHTLVGGLSTNAGGPTIDQVIADVPGVADRTPIRGVHVRVCKAVSTDGDGGTTYSSMSHRLLDGDLIPQNPLTSPAAVWTYLFGEYQPKPDDSSLRTHILDYVKEDVDRLKPQLGAHDNSRLDAHLEGISQLEDVIASLPPECTLPLQEDFTLTNSDPQEPDRVQVNLAMAQLIAYAFICDVTRIASFCFKRFVSNTTFADAGIAGVHHVNSHAGPTNASYMSGVQYQMSRLFDVIATLRDAEEFDGSNLLDSTILYATTDCSTPNTHTISRQPIIVAGTGRGYLVHPGIHHQAVAWNGNNGSPNSTGNMTDVLLTCLRCFDPEAPSAGGGAPFSDTPLTQIIA